MRFDFVATIKKRKEGETHNKGSSYVRGSVRGIHKEHKGNG
jgi:hypothetical protein